MCWRKIKALFSKKPRDVAPRVLPKLKRLTRWSFARFIKTSRGGLDAPKSQRCPRCGANAKRKEKLPLAVQYGCRCKYKWVVPYPQKAGLARPPFPLPRGRG